MRSATKRALPSCRRCQAWAGVRSGAHDAPSFHRARWASAATTAPPRAAPGGPDGVQRRHGRRPLWCGPAGRGRTAPVASPVAENGVGGFLRPTTGEGGHVRRRRRLVGAGLALAVAAGWPPAQPRPGPHADVVHQPRQRRPGGDRQAVHRRPRTASTRSRPSLLPRDAASQREQLARRLAAKDSSIDIMSLDPPFIPELAEPGLPRAGAPRTSPRRRPRASSRAPSTAPPGRASSSPCRSGPTPSCSGTASPWPRPPGST